MPCVNQPRRGKGLDARRGLRLLPRRALDARRGKACASRKLDVRAGFVWAATLAAVFAGMLAVSTVANIVGTNKVVKKYHYTETRGDAPSGAESKLAGARRGLLRNRLATRLAASTRVEAI